MPELPEVETVRRGLADRLSLFEIERLEVCRPRAIASPGGVDVFSSGLTGARVGTWSRRGKYLMATLEPDRGVWGVHLRMTGQFQWIEQPSDPCTHTRVRFWNANGDELGFVDVRSFGEMWWVPPDVELTVGIPGLSRLGPEAFIEQFSAAYLKQRLKNSSRPIKTALLDQALVAGVGNIYADEALWDARINPATRRLSRQRADELVVAIRRALESGLAHGGTTLRDYVDSDGARGGNQHELACYGRGGEPCLRCGEELRTRVIDARTTTWCPVCQAR